MKLFVIGFGPGSAGGMTIDACNAIQSCDVIYGYTAYTALIESLFPGKTCISTGMRQEQERVQLALNAAQSRNCALVCSGDAELYGMAGLAFELSGAYPAAEIVVIPGVSAAFSGGALLGAPLTHDFAVISLSDLLTPWEQIETRLRCAAEGDFAVCLYNPGSHKRKDYLSKACGILLEKKSPDTVCGTVRNIGREGEEKRILTLKELKDTEVDMFTTVFIGSRGTENIRGRMVTRRGYHKKLEG